MLFVTVLEDLMIAIVIGIVFAVLNRRNEITSFIKIKSKILVSGLKGTEFEPKNIESSMLDEIPVLLLKPMGPLFFGSVEPMIESYNLTKKHEILIVDLSSVSMIDLTGVFALEDLIKNAMMKNIEVFIINIEPQIEKILLELGFNKNIGSDNFKASRKSIMSILEKRYDLLSRSQS